MIKGPIKMDYRGEEYSFDTGDSFYFDSRINHSWENEQEENAVILGVNFDYRRF